MKKLLCGVLIVVMMLSLVACGNKLSGTYVSKGEYITYEFSGSNVTLTVKSLIKTIEMKGTYEIKDDKITINMEEDNSGLIDIISGVEALVGIEGLSDALTSGTHEFEKTDDGIKIDGMELTKK